MPYVSALVKEVLRWKNVTPIGMYLIGIPSSSHNFPSPAIPHFLATEDEYRGYRLPAGSIVIGNTWSVIQNPRFFSISELCPPAGRFYTTKYFNLSVLIWVLAQHDFFVAHVSRSICLQTRAFLARREAQSRCEGSRLRGLRVWTEVRLTRTDFHLSFTNNTESVPGGTWRGRLSGSRWYPFSRRSTSTRPSMKQATLLSPRSNILRR